MAKFERLHRLLLGQGLIRPDQIVQPISIARHDLVLARRDAPEGQCAAGRQDAHASEHA